MSDFFLLHVSSCHNNSLTNQQIFMKVECLDIGNHLNCTFLIPILRNTNMAALQTSELDWFLNFCVIIDCQKKIKFGVARSHIKEMYGFLVFFIVIIMSIVPLGT
jgi:hypothetical protein